MQYVKSHSFRCHLIIRFGPLAVIKRGGKCFDIQVELVNTIALDAIRVVEEGTEVYNDVQENSLNVIQK